jgi:hypothetical protein
MAVIDSRNEAIASESSIASAENTFSGRGLMIDGALVIDCYQDTLINCFEEDDDGLRARLP